MIRVGRVLQGLGAENPLGRRLAESRALEAWPEIVGGPLAARTRPLRLAGGRLLVLAPGSSLRQELVFHKAMILRRFNEYAGRALAREIIFLDGAESALAVSAEEIAGQETL